MTSSPQTLALALDAYRSGNPAEAARIYRQAVAKDLKTPTSGACWESPVGRWATSGADQAYREALRLWPGFVEARIN